jgi:hypothetical protein
MRGEVGRKKGEEVVDTPGKRKSSQRFVAIFFSYSLYAIAADHNAMQSCYIRCIPCIYVLL